LSLFFLEHLKMAEYTGPTPDEMIRSYVFLILVNLVYFILVWWVDTISRTDRWTHVTGSLHR